VKDTPRNWDTEYDRVRFQPSLTGLARFRDLYPGLRPGLLSAVPCGTSQTATTQTLKGQGKGKKRGSLSTSAVVRAFG
jgi:hypothetical protein